MNTRLLFTFYLILFNTALLAQVNELELISIHQLDPDYQKRFDLSGLAEKEGRIYGIADKEYNTSIYGIDLEDIYWKISEDISFSIEGKHDIEALDTYKNRFYLIDEKTSRAYSIDDSGKAEEINIKWNKKTTVQSGTNAGYEGLAIDGENNRLILAKERQPRFITIVNLEDGEVEKVFNFTKEMGADYSDIKLKDGFLYALERNRNLICKIDMKNHKVVDQVSYAEVCSHPDGKLYEPSKYGMAEALLIREDEIWIGIDNNYLEVSDHARKTHGMEGKNPAIIRFKRPPGF